MINAVIIDDEVKSILTLQKMLNAYCPSVNVLGAAENALSAKAVIALNSPQLVFLDIEMPYGSGFDLLKSISKIDFEIIFITAFNQYALNAFRFSAIDYLLKPINITELIQAVERAEERISQKASLQNYQILLNNISEQNTGLQQLVLSDVKGQYIVQLNDILYCMADRSYSAFHFIQAKPFTSSRNLKEYEDLLPANQFCRIHRSHIVNMKFIVKILKGRGGMVVMQDGTKLEISVRKKDAFLKLYKEFLK